MINKSENATSNASISMGAPSANIQTIMGNLVDVSNTSDTSLSALPLEMIYHVGSFLKLKDKISFSQALIDSGFSVSLSQREILQKFSDELLTEKINILLDCKNKNYDFSKFYSDTQSEETENLYSLLFEQMCVDFKTRKALSEVIVALVEQIEATAFVMRPHHHYNYQVEVINADVVDGDRIRAYVDRVDVNESKDTEELIDHLFPNLADQDIRKELEQRVQEFDSKKDLLYRQYSYSPLALTKKLLAFLKMEEQYRGIPIKVAARTQKLASSHLQPVIQKANEKMQTMSIEVLRAWLVMTVDKEQVEDFCEKIIEIGAKDNPFYAKGSPYHHMLKHDLLYRMALFSASDSLPYGCKVSNQAYMCYISYYADGEDIKYFIDSLMTKMLAIQIKNGEDPVSETQPKDFFSPCLAYRVQVGDFHRRMEERYRMVEFLKQAYERRVSLTEALVPTPDTLAMNSPEHMLSCFARNECFFSSLVELLRANSHYVNAQDINGDTLLHLAIKIDSDMIEILADLNADLNIKNKEGLTPLMLAVQLENMRHLSELLKHQTLDVNKCDNFGNTALHHAILANKKMAMHRLLRHGATDKTITNADGKTPCELAESLGLLSLYNTLNSC